MALWAVQSHNCRSMMQVERKEKVMGKHKLVLSTRCLNCLGILIGFEIPKQFRSFSICRSQCHLLFDLHSWFQ